MTAEKLVAFSRSLSLGMTKTITGTVISNPSAVFRINSVRDLSLTEPRLEFVFSLIFLPSFIFFSNSATSRLEGKKHVEQYVQKLTHEIKSPLSRKWNLFRFHLSLKPWSRAND